MSRVLPVVAGIFASSVGCAQLAGINETNGKNRNKDSLALRRTSVGTTVISTSIDLTGMQATYLLPTDTPGFFDRVPAVEDASSLGTWTQDLADPAPVEFTLPDDPMPVPRLFALPNRALSVQFTSLEHLNYTPAPAGATLTVTAPLDVPVAVTDSFQVYTVGAWSLHALATPVAGTTQIGPVAYAFNTTTTSSRSGRPQLDRITTQDAFFVLRYSGTGLTGVAEAPAFDQTGTDTVVTPKMALVTQDQTIDVKVSPPSLAMRYATVRPSVATLAMNWSAVAAPGYSDGIFEGPVLQRGALVMTDVGVTGIKYGNPFVPARDWHTTFALQTSESRAYTPAGSLPVTLFAGMDQFIDPTAVLPGFELTEPASLPVLISIDGKQLAIDGLTITAPAKFVEVTFLPENMTDTLFSLQVFDLLPNTAGTALEYHLAFFAVSNDATMSHEARFQVPPEIFQVGHRYTLRAVCIHEGFPAFTDGDFTNRQLPLSQSYLDSGVFTVMP